MEINFHYYVTYTAAVKAGFPTDEAALLARAAQYVDECFGETTQSNTDVFFNNVADTLPFYYGKIREILRIWPVFHFLPGDVARVQADVDPTISRSRKQALCQAPDLLCGTESHMTRAIVEDAKVFWGTAGVSSQQKLLRVGITMHVLADTFAHQGFAGIPRSDINAVSEVKTLEMKGLSDEMRTMKFGFFDSSPAISNSSFGYLGHGRIGHVPDQPGMTFSCQIQWRKATDKYMVRCNPLEFYCAYLQMMEAMRYIRGDLPTFSNQVDRAMLLDTQRSRPSMWTETMKFIDMYNAAATDAALVRPWFQLVKDVEVPADYETFHKKADAALISDFVLMTTAFRNCVFAECTALNAYYELYN